MNYTLHILWLINKEKSNQFLPMTLLNKVVGFLVQLTGQDS